MVGTDQTCEQLADAIIANLDATYELVYVDYRDGLSDEQAAAVVRGDGEALFDSLADFEGDQRYESCRQVIDEALGDVLREWEAETDADLSYLRDAFPHSEAWDRVRYEIEERDRGDWLAQLARNTGRVLLRINVIDEDHGYSFASVEPERVLVDVGLPLPATEANVATVRATLAECSPEYSVLMGYWIVGVDLSDILKLPSEGEVEIVNPYLYLGNPFTGSGFISPKPLQARVRVARSDLTTDKDAFGYAVDEIYGGLRPSDFEADLIAVG